jgi:hypothetical protein
VIDNGEVDDLSFGEKFWRIIERLRWAISLEAFGVKVSAEVQAPSPGLRLSNDLETLERGVASAYLERGCSDSCGFTLLVDQLEKVWSGDRDADSMIIGLLQATKHASSSYPGVRCITFLRTYMYELLEFQDRDKFRGDETHIDWDEKLLLDLLLARAEASLGRTVTADELWTNVFPAEIEGKPASRYLIEHTLMRPRDAIQFANACRDAAFRMASVRP